MNRIADNFPAIAARLAELKAEKAKARGDEPKASAPEYKLYGETTAINGAVYKDWGTYQAPDDYCGFKHQPMVELRYVSAQEYRDNLFEASLASSRALKKSSDELSRALCEYIEIDGSGSGSPTIPEYSIDHC